MKMTHKHDVYFSPHSTEAHSLVMQIADYCNKRGIWYKISESTLGIGIVYGGNVGYVIDTDRKTENSSGIPNNCEHITEDGVTCAKYPACDDCPDNPLNKVKGSERLVKGSEQTEPTISKMEQVEPQTCSFSDCDNFKNPDYERCIECKRKQIKLKTEQTGRSE